MADYVCIRKCYHRGKVYVKGDPYNLKPDEKEAPRHFAKKGAAIPDDPTPRLGTRVSGKTKLPSVKAPGKADFPEVKE